MITNTSISVYHKTIDPITRIEVWSKSYYEDCWWFEEKGTTIRDGYEINNKVEIRIPYTTNKNINIANFKIGDIICNGDGPKTIQSQSDVSSAYNITSITNNTFGNNPHIHIRGN